MADIEFKGKDWAEEQPTTKEKIGIIITSIFLLIFMLLTVFFSTLAVVDLKEERSRNLLSTTPVAELDREGLVKVSGKIESEYQIVISGDRVDDEWEGTARNFILNDSGSTIFVKSRGDYYYPMIDVKNAPHSEGYSDEFHNGDIVYIIGEYRVENGQNILYMEELSTGPHNFYKPWSGIFYAVFFTFMGCWLFSLVTEITQKEHYVPKRNPAWKSRAEEKRTLIRFLSPGFFIVVPFYIGYLSYSNEKLFAIPVAICLFIGILSLIFYNRCKNAVMYHDHLRRNLVEKVSDPKRVMNRVIKILNENRLRHDDLCEQTRSIKLKDFRMKLKFFITKYDTAPDYKSYRVDIDIGPITPDLEYTLGWKLKSLLDREFDLSSRNS